jgi:acyl-[acyl-carrier-protein]-phospholipid O-acyltransferase/long-chain-fatty-acid--[acyl-carrier-protein] ligase
MCIAFTLLGILSPTYRSVATLIFVAGFFAGFYIVPLQALIQILAPDEERGRIIGTSGAISFCFSSLGPIVFWIAKNPLQIPANRIFLICAAMAIVGTIYGAIQLNKIMAYRAQQKALSTEE